MSTRVDALRNTLDHLALDPKASEDRRYLVSMLRRLGYSDAEIEAELGPVGGEPGRVIEVEYEGPVEGRRASPRSRETTFQVSGPEDGLRFRIADDDGPAGAGVEEVHHTDLSGVESDLGDWGDDFEQGPRDDLTRVDEAGEAPGDFGAWGDDREDESFSFQEDSEEVVEFRAATRPDPAVAAGWQEAEETTDAWGDQSEASWGEPAEPEADLAWAPAETEQTEDAWSESEETEAWPEEPAPEQWSDTAPTVAEAEAAQEELVPWPEDAEAEPVEETEAWPSEETTAWPEESEQETETPGETAWPEADETLQAEDGWEDASWEDVDEAPAPAAAPAAPAPYVHGDYTLYTREVHLSTGREQRIYFFAKNKPQSGEPCPLPEGYEVIENDKTGLPFLRRQR